MLLSNDCSKLQEKGNTIAGQAFITVLSWAHSKVLLADIDFDEIRVHSIAGKDNAIFMILFRLKFIQ